MTTPDHPLTETAAAEMWDEHRDPSAAPFHAQGRLYRRGQTALIRAAYDAGRADASKPDDRPWQDCTVEDICAGDLVEARYGDFVRIGTAHHQDEDGDWCTKGGHRLTEGDRWPLRRIPAPTPEKETAMTKTTPAASSEPLARTLLGIPDTHGAPHHDADQIKAGDYVMQVDRGTLVHHGIAHHQDEDGDWATEGGKFVTAAALADRPDAITVWPAPTPPAEEITLPTEHPAHLTDVEIALGDHFAYMALDCQGLWVGVDQDGRFRAYRPHALVTFTLPDGTRARRDGEHADGTPRFVKVQEGEK